MPRTVTALVTTGDRCGRVGPFPVSSPFWAEVAPVVAHLHTVLGVPAYVLRLLHVDGGAEGRDGHVTYHVSAPGSTAALPPVDPPTDVHPARARWATAHGLDELFAWTAETLAAQRITVTGPVAQHRTWNLAGLFRVPTSAGPVWLKAGPPFAADEARVMAAFAALDPTLVPTVLAAAPGRMLLADIPGTDWWDPPPTVLTSTVHRFVAAQARLDAPPWLPARGPDQVRALLDRDLGLTPAEVARARALLDRAGALEDCGLPDTVVHGDFHTGNWRGTPPVVLDFADAHRGNPVLDGLRLGDFLDRDRAATARAAWTSAWRRARPGCDPERALAVGAPLARLLQAVRYQEFLDGIEESERVYHEGDPAAAVRAALAAESIP